MSEKRYCAECGSTRRMVSQPDSQTLCTVCTGQERHPSFQSSEGQRTLVKGYYNDQKQIDEMLRQPGQGHNE